MRRHEFTDPQRVPSAFAPNGYSALCSCGVIAIAGSLERLGVEMTHHLETKRDDPNPTLKQRARAAWHGWKRGLW